MSDGYEQRKNDIDRYVAAMPMQPGQQGLVMLLNGQPLAADFVSNGAAWADLHEKLVKSFAVEAMIRPTEETSQADLLIEGHRLLHALDLAEERTYPAVALGGRFSI